MGKKLPLWKDRPVSEDRKADPITDEELEKRINAHHAACLEWVAKVQRFLDENK